MSAACLRASGSSWIVAALRMSARDGPAARQQFSSTIARSQRQSITDFAQSLQTKHGLEVGVSDDSSSSSSLKLLRADLMLDELTFADQDSPQSISDEFTKRLTALQSVSAVGSTEHMPLKTLWTTGVTTYM